MFTPRGAHPLRTEAVDLAPGNRIAAYRYDPDAVELELCIQNENGAFASYDTAPMSPVRQGETGGCPQL